MTKLSRSKPLHLVLALGAGLALAGCDRQDETAIPPEPAPEPAAEAPEEPVSIIRDDIEVAREDEPMAKLEATIPFGEGGTELSAAALEELEGVLSSQQVEAGGAIVLRGHSDAGGNDAVNQRVSRRRAEVVRDYLMDKGIAEDRITVIAFGEQNPVKPNALPDGKPDEAGRAANRRVELTIRVPEGTPEAQPTGEPQTIVEQFTQPVD